MASDLLRKRIGSFISSRWKFEWRYWRGNTPWDTNITPPEVMAFIAAAPPGKALDLGCGTCTNAITLARHGERMTAIRRLFVASRELHLQTELLHQVPRFITAGSMTRGFQFLGDPARALASSRLLENKPGPEFQ